LTATGGGGTTSAARGVSIGAGAGAAFRLCSCHMTTIPPSAPTTTSPIIAILRLFAGAAALSIVAAIADRWIAEIATPRTVGELLVTGVTDDTGASDGTVTGSDLAAGTGTGMGAGVGLRIMRAALIETV